MKFRVEVTLLIGLVSVNCIDLSDWKPIVGPSSLKSIPQQFVVDTSVVGSSSSSKSTITFNGQTITTSIGGDGSANEAVAPVLSVGPSNLESDIDTESRYLDYPGKVLSGFFSASSAVSIFSSKCSVSTAFRAKSLHQIHSLSVSQLSAEKFNYRMKIINHQC